MRSAEDELRMCGAVLVEPSPTMAMSLVGIEISNRPLVHHADPRLDTRRLSLA